ncbi:hypothetical protein PWT90_01586 [Aphanocladium album]|nr:hypothetical protein PWT90_01586 [Aphanocladium album]
MSYKISDPDEYLAITGMGIKNVKITKAAWVWPLQRCTRFSVQPQDYAMDLLAMTKEKLQFALPVVFTVGPDVNSRGANTTVAASDEDEDDLAREDRGDALMKYAMLLSQGDDSNKEGRENKQRHVASIIKGIIEGETRVLVSSMTMEEIFTEREMFKKRIFRNIQSELNQFGLRIWNSNVKELKDAPNSVYFESLSRKAHEGATNQARIDVAEAQLKGNVGEAQRRGEQEREIAKIHAETAVQKTERDIERAQAEAHLATRQTALNRDVDIAQVTAQRTLQSTDEDLKKTVEIKRAAAELERLRATDLVKATIAKESKQQAADAAAYEVAADARAKQEAKQRDADADAYRVRLDAEATSYATQQTADADNFRRLNPAEAMRNVYQMLPPLMSTINEQTGITLPEWQFGKLNAAQQAMQQEQGKSGKVNGGR